LERRKGAGTGECDLVQDICGWEERKGRERGVKTSRRKKEEKREKPGYLQPTLFASTSREKKRGARSRTPTWSEVGRKGGKKTTGVAGFHASLQETVQEREERKERSALFQRFEEKKKGKKEKIRRIFDQERKRKGRRKARRSREKRKKRKSSAGKEIAE